MWQTLLHTENETEHFAAEVFLLSNYLRLQKTWNILCKMYHHSKKYFKFWREQFFTEVQDSTDKNMKVIFSLLLLWPKKQIYFLDYFPLQDRFCHSDLWAPHFWDRSRLCLAFRCRVKSESVSKPPLVYLHTSLPFHRKNDFYCFVGCSRPCALLLWGF